MAIKPNYTTQQIVTKLTTTWGGGYNGYFFNWTTPSISYSINSGTPTNNPGTAPAEGDKYYVSMTPAQVQAAELAFQLWADLIAKPMVETTSPAAQITLDYSSKTSGNGTYTAPFGTANSASKTVVLSAEQVWMSSNWPTNVTVDVLGGYGFNTIVHEIGHALGLSHPGNYNAGSGRSITYANSAVFAQDNREYTVMSYFGGYLPGSGWQQDGTSTKYLYSQTPMVYDIAAIQAKYGANMTTRTGDTTYGFNCTVTGTENAIYDFSVNKTPIYTIWDAGGNDTLDCSGYAGSQTINLTPGSYSSVDGMMGNVAIAFDCIIENAIGGNGNDVLIAGLSGDNLTGGLGNDEFDINVGIDQVTDLGRGIDILKVWSGATANATLANSWTATSSTVNNGAAILTSNGYSVNLSAVTQGLGFKVMDTGGAVAFKGSGLNDILIGGDASDSLTGGKGSDRLTGGAARDVFIFNAGDSGQAVSFDFIADYQKGFVGTGDSISFSSALNVGGSATAATSVQASINQSNGVATFYTGTGQTLSSALAVIAARFTAATDAAGEFAFFRVAGTGDYYEFISDGRKGVTANDVVIDLVGLTSINTINLTSGVLTIVS